MQSGDMRYRSRLVALVVIGSLPGVFYFMGAPSADVSSRSSPSEASTVRAAPVQLKLSGELLPVNQTEVISRLSGKVIEVRFKVGDFVSAGTVIAVIHSSDLAERMSALEAAVAAARQTLRLREEQATEAEERLAENRKFLRQDLIARRELEPVEMAAKTARAQADLARAHLAQQQAMRAQIQTLQSLTRLTASISGVISRRLVEAGAVISEGAAIVTLTDLDTLKLTGKVSGRGAEGLRRGMKVQVTAPAVPGMAATGKVVGLRRREGDVETALDVEIRIDNRQRVFRPGMAADAHIGDAGNESI